MTSAPGNGGLLVFLDRLYKDGDINHFIHVWEKNQKRLWVVLPELWEKIIFAIETTPCIVTPESWQRLDRIARGVHDPALSKTIAALRKKGKLPPKAEIGFLWFPVYTSRGHILGLRVTDRGSEEIGKERLKLLDEVGNAVYSALRTQLPFHGFLPWRPDRFSFQIVNIFGEEQTDVTGRSLTLPLALAIYSKAFQVPIPVHVSASADVSLNDPIRGVGSIGEKLTALQRERPFVTEVLVADGQKDLPSPTGLKVKQCKCIGDALQQTFGASFPPSMTRFIGPINTEDEAHALQRLYADGLHDTCIANASLLIGYLEQVQCPLPKDASIRALFTAYWRRGSCHCHRGDADCSVVDLKKAQDLSRKHGGIVQPHEYVNSRINLAVLLKDLFRYKEAEARHRSVERDLKKGRGTNKERGKNESSWSQLCLAMGRFAEAEAKQRLAISLNRLGSDRYRNYNYLGQIYTRWGRFPQAKTALDKADGLLSSATHHLNQSNRGKDRAFLDLYRAEYLYRYGNTLKKRKGILEELLAIYKAVAENQTWIRPLTWKWVALGLLWEEQTSNRGLSLFAEACAYYKGQSEPVLRLLEVTTRAERTLHLLAREETVAAPTAALDTVREDVTEIITCLGMHPDIEKHFQRERIGLKGFVQSGKMDRERIQNALLSLCGKIPY